MRSNILPPMQFQGIPANVNDLTGLFSRRDAERYVRDLINVIVEGTGNVQYRLRDRYHLISSQFTGAQLDTAKRWFTGFWCDGGGWTDHGGRGDLC